ncbi:MAG TPA: ATP-binding protein, partial [Steroidobacteraceae bacterium]|nr:ATP-binding protein [Steroidobacteraceae bacterium]
EGGDVAVSVSDQGPGLAPGMEPQLFSPFSTTKPAGTGLGLAMSRTVARAHGGDLEYQANFPRGASFTLTLPGVHSTTHEAIVAA